DERTRDAVAADRSLRHCRLQARRWLRADLRIRLRVDGWPRIRLGLRGDLRLRRRADLRPPIRLGLRRVAGLRRRRRSPAQLVVERRQELVNVDASVQLDSATDEAGIEATEQPRAGLLDLLRFGVVERPQHVEVVGALLDDVDEAPGEDVVPPAVSQDD